MKEPTHKKVYTKPEIILEMDLETRAGSTIELFAPIEEPSADVNITP